MEASSGRRIADLRLEAASCTACDLHRDATQTVFGRGDPEAPVMLVGEQPGNQEDLEGEPIVGPAGKLLERALDSSGIPPAAVYTTNVVKHFKFVRKGKVRLHQRPQAAEIAACRPWLEAELSAVAPRWWCSSGPRAMGAFVDDLRVAAGVLGRR